MDLGTNLSKSFDLYFKDNFATLLVIALVASVVAAATCGILAGPVMAGFFIACLKVLKGEKADMNELFAHFDKFVPTLIFSIILGVGYFILSFILILIPVIGLLALYAIVLPTICFIFSIGVMLIVVQNQTFGDALSNAFKLYTSNLVNNWLYALVFALIGGICWFISMPIMGLGFAMAYQKLVDKAA